jgi:exodeoxyribonuclease-3
MRAGQFPRRGDPQVGNHAVWKGERSWNGVAILAGKREPVLIRDALPGNIDDKQSRYIEAAVEGIAIASIYLPNGNPQPGPKFRYKLAWFDRLADHADELLAQDVPAVLAGDYNVVPTDFDIYATRSYKDNALLQPAPRVAYAKLLSAGWTDALRTLYPDDPMYTFWSYLRNRWPRNAGLRLDHLLLSPAIAFRLKAAGVDRDVRGEPEASDHAPSWIELKSARRGGPKRERRSRP